MKQVNELASQQDERNTKLATQHQKVSKQEIPVKYPRGKGNLGPGNQMEMRANRFFLKPGR